MEYSVNELAQISGVSTRTLRYYDNIGLLRAGRIEENGYRVYTSAEADKLAQILFYRELGFRLDEIGDIVNSPSFDRESAMVGHLNSLIQRRDRLDALIANVRKTISSMKGEIAMTDREKFEGFKKKAVRENEEKYGNEIRSRYGDEVVDKSNEKRLSMTEEQWDSAEALEAEIKVSLKNAAESGNPAGPDAQRTCLLHKQWLTMCWPDGMYSKEMHRAIAESYVADERFKAYYDAVAPGAAEFLKQALDIYCAD